MIENKSKLSPMMQHYLQIKEEHPDCLIFYRLGDFYEMFFEDAEIVSNEAGLTLTGKSCGLEERAPMAGVPFHSVDIYLNKLVKNGHRVAIVEQVEDPKLVKGGQLVKREVTRIVTPGTIMGEEAVSEDRNNYIMALYYASEGFGMAVCDVTTGDFFMSELPKAEDLFNELAKLRPAEVLIGNTISLSGLDMESAAVKFQFTLTWLRDNEFDEIRSVKLLLAHFKGNDLDSLGVATCPAGAIASGALLAYLMNTQKNDLSHIHTLRRYVSGQYMILDTQTRRNLELLETMRDKERKGSLLWVLDKTKTPMGKRLLRTMIEQPLLKKEAIEERLTAVEEFGEHMVDRDEMREYLSPVHDIERLLGKICYKSANARDLLAFLRSTEMMPAIIDTLADFQSDLILREKNALDPLTDLTDMIRRGIVDEPPLTVREGGMIREGFDEEVDRYRQAKTEGTSWLSALEEEEREKTGISKLKIKFNKVFGYYFEVTNSFKNMVPDYFIRKQTLVGAERYTTEKLKEMEDTILGAEEKLLDREYKIFCSLTDQIASQIARIQKTAQALAMLDVLGAFSTVAVSRQYVRPVLNEEGVIDIKEGRHPVVEQVLKDGGFVTNDVFLDEHNNRLAIITGPNMAGKSTYMRQTALIVLMAQIGSFVPASEANIGLCDQIFTRVGASDDLASGQSTFMVEMAEVSHILKHATRNSLIILDEIGRGTSTFDGLSIAWAVAEYVSDKKTLGAKTLFATHYHELTELEGALPGVKNYCIAVKEQGEDIVFLRKIVAGGADKSYGIQVAKLAGLPEQVLKKARDIMEELTSADIVVNAGEVARERLSKRARRGRKETADGQFTLFDYYNGEKGQFTSSEVETQGKEEGSGKEQILDRIKNCNVSDMTPMQALNLLYELQELLKK